MARVTSGARARAASESETESASTVGFERCRGHPQRLIMKFTKADDS